MLTLRASVLAALVLCLRIAGDVVPYIQDTQHDVYDGMRVKDTDQLPESEYIVGTKHFGENLESIGVRCASNTTCGFNESVCLAKTEWLRQNNARSNWRTRHPHILRVFKEHLNKTQTAKIAEVGIALGGLSFALLSELLRDGFDVEYHGIDPFLPNYDNKDAMSKLLRGHNSSLWARAILQEMGEFDCRFTLHHKASLLGAADFDNSSLDIIFLDGDHGYASVLFDIKAWLPKLKTGGILMFDDFSRFFPGVVRALTEFAVCHNNTVLPVDGSPGNCYIRKHSDHMPVVGMNMTIFGDHHVSCHEFAVTDT